MATCNICLDTIGDNTPHFRCPQCKSTACGECLWAHCNTSSLVPECFGLKCHRQLSNEELYVLNPDTYPQWLNLLKEKIFSKALLDAQFSYQNQREKTALLYQNVALGAIKFSNTASEEDKKKASETMAINIERMQELTDVTIVSTVNPWLILCPTTNCTGLLDSTHKCALCDNRFCTKCNGHLTVGHECKPQDVESVTEIRSRCKPCPKCHSMIYRAEGCSQMWCTNCKHAFDWNTGKLLDTSRNYHNPDYMEYIRRRPNTQEAPIHIDINQCELLLPLQQVNTRAGYNVLKEQYEWLTELAREQEGIPDKLIELNRNREWCMHSLALVPITAAYDKSSNTELSVNVTESSLFHIHMKMCYLYDYEQLIATILPIGIGIINTATKTNVDNALEELKILKGVFEDRMQRLKVLYTNSK